MTIGNTDGAVANRGGGGSIEFPQRRGGQEEVTKSGKVIINIKGGMADGGSEERTTMVREIKHKGGT